MAIKIAKQYIKELSINVPNSPEIFMESNDKPNIDIAIDIDAKKISDLAYEVVLQLKATAGEGGRMFEANINYGGMFAFDGNQNVEDTQEVLLVDCPTLLFPFARNILSNITSDAGFSPLMIDPIDFKELYQKRKESVTVN